MSAQQPTAVFIPVYNEAEKIGGTLARILDIAGDRIDMLVVADDGSTDGSRKIASRFTKHVVPLGANSGNGACTRAALQYIANVSVDWHSVIRIDGDGQHDPKLLPHVMSRLENSADVVVCSRFHPESDMRHAPLDRRLLNASAALWLRETTSWPVTDARSGFLGFRWSVLAPVIGALRTERYGVPIELLLRVWHSNRDARFEEIPHPALYQRGISRRLDAKYCGETVADKVGRMNDAYRVYHATCEDLGIL